MVNDDNEEDDRQTRFNIAKGIVDCWRRRRISDNMVSGETAGNVHFADRALLRHSSERAR